MAGVRIRVVLMMRALRDRGVSAEWFEAASIRDYRVAVFHKYYDDEAYRLASRLKDSGARIVVDICDQHLYNPKSIPDWSRRGDQLRRMLASADQIVASTETLAAHFRAVIGGTPPIAVIGDAMDDLSAVRMNGVSRVRRKLMVAATLRRIRNLYANGYFPILWFGNHGSPYADGGMLDLLPLREPLAAISRDRKLQLTVVSNDRQKFVEHFGAWNIPCHYVEWSAATFPAVASAHEVALIPAQENPFTWCKTDNRVVTALMHGLAVVAAPLPSYQTYRDVALLGDVAALLPAYLDDPSLRAHHAECGLRQVRGTRSLDVVAGQWQRLLEETAGGTTNPSGCASR